MLENLYSRVSKGGVILLDDYANVFPGANKAVDDFFKNKNAEIKRLLFAVTPCFIIKNEF